MEGPALLLTVPSGSLLGDHTTSDTISHQDARWFCDRPRAELRCRCGALDFKLFCNRPSVWDVLRGVGATATAPQIQFLEGPLWPG